MTLNIPKMLEQMEKIAPHIESHELSLSNIPTFAKDADGKLNVAKLRKIYLQLTSPQTGALVVSHNLPTEEVSREQGISHLQGLIETIYLAFVRCVLSVLHTYEVKYQKINMQGEWESKEKFDYFFALPVLHFLINVYPDTDYKPFFTAGYQLWESGWILITEAEVIAPTVVFGIEEMIPGVSYRSTTVRKPINTKVYTLSKVLDKIESARLEGIIGQKRDEVSQEIDKHLQAGYERWIGKPKRSSLEQRREIEEKLAAKGIIDLNKGWEIQVIDYTQNIPLVFDCFYGYFDLAVDDFIHAVSHKLVEDSKNRLTQEDHESLQTFFDSMLK